MIVSPTFSDRAESQYTFFILIYLNTVNKGKAFFNNFREENVYNQDYGNFNLIEDEFEVKSF